MADDAFDPRQHMSRIQGGAPYLEVRWRLVWLRDQHPDADLVTEMIERSDRHAIFRATITLRTGGKATGWGSETADDFRDFIEKAETKAIGRALNALGFGLPELELDGDRGPAGRPVDQRDRRAQAAADLAARQASAEDGGPPLEQRATGRQLGYLRVVAREVDVDADAAAQETYGVPAQHLTRVQASRLIEQLQNGPRQDSM